MVCVETTWNLGAFDLDIAMCVLWSNRSSQRTWCWQPWIWSSWWCTSGMCTKSSFVQRGAGNGLVLMACENGSWRIVPWRWPQALVGPTICWWHIGVLYNIRQGVPFVRWAGCFACRSRFDIECEKNEDFNNSGPTPKTATNSWWGDGGCSRPCFSTQMARVLAPSWRVPSCRCWLPSPSSFTGISCKPMDLDWSTCVVGN